MTDLDLLVLAHNAPPVDGGIERLVDGICRHVAPGRTALARPPHEGADALPYPVHPTVLVGARPPRWWATRKALTTLPPSTVTVCAEWWPEARALASLPRRRRAGTRVAVVHGTEVVRSLADRRLRRSLTRSLHGMDVVIADSEYTAALARGLGVTPIVVLPGVDLEVPVEDPATVARELDLEGRRIVLTVARLVPRKGHRLLLPHWPQVVAAAPDAVWVIAGDGPERAHLESVAGASVRLLGRVEERRLRSLYRLADVHVMPGIEVDGDVEGFGMAAVEAAAGGAPTVATGIGGVGEAIGDGGIVVAPGDHAALAAALVEVLTDDDLRARLRARARARAEDLAWPHYGARFRRAVGLDGAP